MDTDRVVRLDDSDAASLTSAVADLRRHGFLPVARLPRDPGDSDALFAALKAGLAAKTFDDPAVVDELLHAIRGCEISDPRLYEVGRMAEARNLAAYALHLLTDGTDTDCGMEQTRSALTMAGEERAAVYMVLREGVTAEGATAGVSFGYAPPYPNVENLVTGGFAPCESHQGDPPLSLLAVWLEIILHELVELAPESGIDPHPAYGNADGVDQWDWARGEMYGLLERMRKMWPVDTGTRPVC